ncbi:hypothetical protein ADUPG1_011094, partial [Aduncisulcus paluster]
SFEDCSHLVEKSKSSNPELALAVSLGFLTLARLDSLLLLRVADVQYIDEGLTISFPKTKTRPTGFKIRIPPTAPLFPGRLVSMLSYKPALQQILRLPDESDQQMRYRLTTDLSSAAAKYLRHHMTFHSIRRGSASCLLTHGVPEAVIMALGTWKSRESFLSYVEEAVHLIGENDEEFEIVGDLPTERHDSDASHVENAKESDEKKKSDLL